MLDHFQRFPCVGIEPVEHNEVRVPVAQAFDDDRAVGGDHVDGPAAAEFVALGVDDARRGVALAALHVFILVHGHGEVLHVDEPDLDAEIELVAIGIRQEHDVARALFHDLIRFVDEFRRLAAAGKRIGFFAGPFFVLTMEDQRQDRRFRIRILADPADVGGDLDHSDPGGPVGQQIFLFFAERKAFCIFGVADKILEFLLPRCRTGDPGDMRGQFHAADAQCGFLHSAEMNRRLRCRQRFVVILPGEPEHFRSQTGLVITPVIKGEAEFYFLFGKICESNALHSFANSKAKIVIVHSEDDQTVPIEAGFTLYKKQFGKDKRFKFIKLLEHGHGTVYYTLEGKHYYDKVHHEYDKFVKKNKPDEEAKVAYIKEHLDREKYNHMVDTKLIKKCIDFITK